MDVDTRKRAKRETLSEYGRSWSQTYNLPMVMHDFLDSLGEGNKNRGLRTLIEANPEFKAWIKEQS